MSNLTTASAADNDSLKREQSSKKRKVWVKNGATEKKRERLVFLLLAVAICVMRLWYVRDLYAPIVYDDEVGYWSHAANLAGLSWTGVGTLWYSYGYSLLLMPLFLLTHNMGILYRLAIGENALLGVSSFWIGFHIILELDKDFDKLVAMFISFVAASYSAYIFQANIAWSETFVYTWFLLTVLLAIRFCKKPTYLNTILLTAAAAFLCAIHNRTVVICIALLLTLIYMWLRRQISWKHVALAAGILAVFYAANAGIREYLTALMWGEQRQFTGNSVASQSGKMKLFSSARGVKRLCMSFAGKLWYLFSSTFLVGYLGLAALVRNFIVSASGKHFSVKKRKPERRQLQRSEITNRPSAAARSEAGMDSAFLFMLFSVLGTLALATLAAVPKLIEAGGSCERLDSLFYGRYSDMITGLLLLLGLTYLYQSFEEGQSIRSALFGAVPGLLIYGICFAVVQGYLTNLGSYVINIPCVPGVWFLRFDNYTISFVKISAIAVILFVLILLGFYFLRHRLTFIGAKVRCVLVGFGMIGVFLITSWNGYRTYIKLQQSYNYTYFSESLDLLEANTDYPIYGVNLGEHYTYRQYMRLSVVDGDISYGLPAEDADNYFLIGDAAALETLDFTSKHCYYVMIVEEEEMADVYVLAVGDEIAEKLESQGYTCTLVTSLPDLEALAEKDFYG
ncbi:MAG: hypothetical protein LIP10_04920 [Clostridiales bacterium]|nr:hypothetical protein [Clostridiales bacterium]